MRGRARAALWLGLGWILISATPPLLRAEPEAVVRVAVWNVRNYLVTDRVVEGRYRRSYPKPEAEKTALRKVLRDVAPDVLALQEMGDERFLRELQRDLEGKGLSYPHQAFLVGPDTERHLAVLSRLPFRAVYRHPALPIRFLKTDGFVKRGVLEVVFASRGREWRIFNLHLKSRYADRADDPGSLERRNGEATAIRNLIAERLAADPETALFVAGDFNDHRASRPLRRFLAINDRPLLSILPATDDRGDAWTHYYAKEDRYARVDFVLASPAAETLLADRGVWIPDSTAMRLASDHRMLVFEVSLP